MNLGLNMFSIFYPPLPTPKSKSTTPMGDPAKVYRHYAGVRSEGWDLSNYALQLTQKAFVEGFRYEGSMRILDRMPLREILRYRWNKFAELARSTFFVWRVKHGLSLKWKVDKERSAGMSFRKGHHIVIVSKGKSK